eukprot:12402188-Karenia_brevis.AAC.1
MSLQEKDLIAGIHQRERKSEDLMTRYGEEIRGNLRLAVFVSTLPREYQEEILKLGSGEKKL